MGKCAITYEEIRFDIRDEDVTECYVFIRADGDCPLGLQGWHHRTFPARISVADICLQEMAESASWPLQAPEETERRKARGDSDRHASRGTPTHGSPI